MTTVGQAPPWALQLVHDLQEAEEMHPQFYVQRPDGEYVRQGCPITVALERVPAEVRVAVELASRWQPEPRPEESPSTTDMARQGVEVHMNVADGRSPQEVAEATAAMMRHRSSLGDHGA